MGQIGPEHGGERRARGPTATALDLRWFQPPGRGAKKITSIGGAFDLQSSCRYLAVDGIVDLPAGPGVVTGHVNLGHWKGSAFIPGLVRQTALMGEVGYNFASLLVSPVLRMEQLWGSGALPDQTRFGGGVAYWPYGHGTNLKLFYNRIKTSGVPGGFNQINCSSRCSSCSRHSDLL